MKILKKHADLFTCVGVALFAFWAVFIFQGFARYGIFIPFNYGGGDDFSSLVTAKLLKESGWFWFNDRIGAPFGTNQFDFTANLLLNFDLIFAKIISLFVWDPIAANNIRYLLIFPMCAVSAFCVFRTLKIGRVISAFGSVIFSFTPYIFFRGTGHFSLSACYFIPLSVLLCIWALQISEDDGYLKVDRTFFKNRKNILTIIFALLIANNGIGYYAFFTCFFLCVVALCNLINTGKLKSVLTPLKTIVTIGVFMFIAIVPSFVYNAINGKNLTAVIRSMGEAETYGLKISQLFIPLNSLGIGFVQKIIDTYNGNMLLINENKGSYLGIFGIIGFLLSFLFLFLRKDKNNDGKILHALSVMNLCAVLFATVGGFSSLFAFVVQMIRGYNRISIFISFISILFLCMVLQKMLDSETLFKKEKVRKACIIGSVAVMTLCVAELLPRFGSQDVEFEYNKSQYNSDKTFVENIEETLGEDAMVFQYPYQQTPEAGPVNNMMDYHLYVGYINSDTLRWSYGGTRGRETDMWLDYVFALAPKEQLDTVCRAGFTGIYIDARAYTPENLTVLTDFFTENLGEKKVSENGNLIFYDLRGYISNNGITVDTAVYTNYPQKQVYSGGQMQTSGPNSYGFFGHTLGNGGTVCSPAVSLDEGKYFIKITGSGLKNAEYGIFSEDGITVPVYEILKSDTEIRCEIILENNVRAIEFRLYNKTDSEVIFNRVEIQKYLK